MPKKKNENKVIEIAGKQKGKVMEQVQIEYNKEKKSDFLKIDPRLIEVVYEENPREQYGEDDDLPLLKEYIRNHGVPGVLNAYRIKGSKDRYHLTHGFRRMRCVMELIDEGMAIARVPVILDKQNTNQTDLLASHLIRNKGKHFTAYEKAKIYKQMMALGSTKEEVAKAGAVSTRYVEKLVEALEGVSKKVLNQVKAGKIGLNTVSAVQKKFPDQVEELVMDAIELAEERIEKENKKPAGKKGKDGKPAKPAKPKASMKDVNKADKKKKKSGNAGKGQSIQPDNGSRYEAPKSSSSYADLEVSKGEKFSPEKQIQRLGDLVSHLGGLGQKDLVAFLNGVQRYMEGEANINGLLSQVKLPEIASK
jgi:ParB/RepB/Spo0J family partition protein